MKVHHLNCGTMVPLGGSLIQPKKESRSGPAHMVCHVLLIETEAGLVLVDSGMGLADIAQPNKRLGAAAAKMLRPRLDPAETALRQIESLGFKASDLRHILLTHLDLDHAGGIADFPQARIHVLADEYAATQAGNKLMEKPRYRNIQWQHGPHWELHNPAGEPWFGFPCVRELPGLPPEILMVPLAGHTRGHAAIAVDAGERWLMHAGDAYFHHNELDAHGPGCPVGLRIFQNLLAIDNSQRLSNQKRLQTLAADHGENVAIFSAHDPWELAQYN